jgi:hypothetical protein
MGPYLFLSLGGYHMKLTKSLLLASAAGLAAVATASAADLPSKKAAPVEYVKVCPAFGPGFFYIPGSDTCLKVGGNFWAEANYTQPFQRANNTLGTRTSLAVTLDARSNTEFGLLRTVVTPVMSYRTGSDNSGSANREGLNFNGGNGEGIGASGKQTQFNGVGYVQLGGFTAGHMGSFFNVIGFNANIGIEGWDQRDLTNTVAYTLSLGNGITATAALEDGTLVNREGVSSYAGVGGAAGTITYGANRLPDYVANITADQSWGKVALSGALHSINTSSPVIGTEYGYAGQLATKINLPMLSTGSYVQLNGVYTNGASGFSLRNRAGDVTSNNTNSFGLGRVAVGMNDIAINTVTNTVSKASVYGVAGEFGYQITPTVLAFIDAGYSNLSWSTSAQSLNAALNPAKMTTVSAGLFWTPVKGFRVFPEIEYAKVDTKNATNAGATTEGAAKKSESAWIGRIQVRRDF